MDKIGDNNKQLDVYDDLLQKARSAYAWLWEKNIFYLKHPVKILVFDEKLFKIHSIFELSVKEVWEG